MSGQKITTAVVLTLVIFITGSWNVLFGQVAGENVGRNIMQMAREKKAGSKEADSGQKESGSSTSQDLLKMRRGEVAEQDTPTAVRPKPAAVAPVTPVTPPAVTEVVSNATAIAEGDEILNLLPANCLVCLRINNLDTSLAALDQYISGASPIPLSIAMLAKMQLGQFLEDPMLTDIDTQGDFVIFAAPVKSAASAQSPIPEILVGMLIPTKGPAFSQSHPASVIPNFNFAMITLKADSPDAPVAVKKEMLTTSLAPALSSDEIKQAKSSPVWGYVNIEKAVELMGPMAFAQLDQAKQMITEAAAAQPEVSEANAQMVAMYFDMLKAAATQVKSLSINITPNPGDLSLNFTLSAIPDSDLSALLQKDPTMKSGYSLAGFLDDSAAVNILAKTNKPLFQKLNIIFTDMFTDILTEAMPADQIDDFKALVADSANSMGSEFALSFSIAPGMPPITIKEIIQIKSPDNFMEMIGTSMDFVNGMYKSMNLPLTLSVAPDSILYKQTQIYTLNFDMQLPPNATEEEKTVFEAMWMDEINCKFAPTTDLMLVTMGPDADQEIRDLIDQALSSKSPAPSGNIKIALDTIANSADTDMIATVNIVRYLSGMGKMMTSMPVPAAQMAGQMLSQINMPTKSCLCLAGNIENGTANLQVVLPKQHLLELTALAMQMQKSMQPQQ